MKTMKITEEIINEINEICDADKRATNKEIAELADTITVEMVEIVTK